MIASTLRLVTTRHAASFGQGMLGGQAPDSSEPDAPDGRFKKLNVPSRGRVQVIDRRLGRVVAETRSAEDGTWQIKGLNEEGVYLVLGLDDNGDVNAAVQDWVVPYVNEG